MVENVDWDGIVNFPKEDDHVFPTDYNSIDHFYSATLMSRPLGQFHTYSEGYKDGAQHLINQCLSTGHGLDYLMYPIVFLYRHYIELRLKELIIDLNYCIHQTSDFPKHHNISILWDVFAQLVIEFEQEGSYDENDFVNAGRVIKEFGSIDPSSFAFRYPIDKQGNDSLTLQMLDIKHFAEVVTRLANFLDAYADYMETYVDTVNDLHREFYNEMYRDYM